MDWENRAKLLSVFLVSAVMVPAAIKAQSTDPATLQDQYVVEAARRSREQKKNATKPVRVISNEDLDTKYFTRGRKGLSFSASPGSQTTVPCENSRAGASAGDQVVPSGNRELLSGSKESERIAAQDAEITKLKEMLAVDREIIKLTEQLANAEDRIDWQKREFALDQDTIYSNPNYTDYETGKATLDAEQQQIVATQDEIDYLRAELAALQGRRTQGAQAIQPQIMAALLPQYS